MKVFLLIKQHFDMQIFSGVLHFKKRNKGFILDVESLLTAEQAVRYNEVFTLQPEKYKEGSASKGFLTKEELVAAAAGIAERMGMTTLYGDEDLQTVLWSA